MRSLADGAHPHSAGVDAGAHGYPRTRRTAVTGRVQERPRGLDPLRRVLFAAHELVEEGDQLVAGEFVDRAVLVEHDLRRRQQQQQKKNLPPERDPDAAGLRQRG